MITRLWHGWMSPGMPTPDKLQTPRERPASCSRFDGKARHDEVRAEGSAAIGRAASSELQAVPSVST